MKIQNYSDSDFTELEKLLKVTGIYQAPTDKRSIIRKKIEYDSESVLVAKDKNKLIGTVFTIYDPWSSFIYHLGVHPDYRNKGIATELMNEAEKRLKRRGINIITLFVEENNEQVVDFYRKRGWNVLCKTFCLEKKI